MGLKLVNKNSSSFLNIIETYAIFRLLGNIPFSKEKLNYAQTDRNYKLCLDRQKIFSELNFTTDGEILSNPGLLLGFKLLKSSSNSMSWIICLS